MTHDVEHTTQFQPWAFFLALELDGHFDVEKRRISNP